MIIDSHTHIGTALNFHMPADMLIAAMDACGVEFTLATNIESVEVDHQQQLIQDTNQITQLESARRMIQIVKQTPDRIGGLIWLKPLTETVTKEIETFIVENKQFIYGLKFHPYHSKVPFNDERMIPYFEMATHLNLPIVTHTAGDECSHPKHVYEMAKKYPHLNFVMVHMGLGTDNEEAISLIAKLPNLFGDSTWVQPEKVLKAIEICGPDKIMFGSDAPINGVNTYENEKSYRFYFNEMHQVVSPQTYEAFMGGNARRLFNIKKI